jgi:hypothetical protein
MRKIIEIPNKRQTVKNTTERIAELTCFSNASNCPAHARAELRSTHAPES